MGAEGTDGGHVCVLYAGDREREELLRTFWSQGQLTWHRRVMAAQEDLAQDFGAEYLGTVQDLFARHGFALDTMIDYWRGLAGAAGSLRLAADPGGVLREPDRIEDLLRYESALNSCVTGHRMSALCLHDVTGLDGSVVITLFRVHPRIRIGSLSLENPYYVLPPIR
jgi:hypothetical protein